MPLKKAKRKGIFCLQKEEKEQVALKTKKKLLNRKEKRKQVLEKLVAEELAKKNLIQTQISELEKSIEAGKNKIALEKPK